MNYTKLNRHSYSPEGEGQERNVNNYNKHRIMDENYSLPHPHNDHLLLINVSVLVLHS